MEVERFNWPNLQHQTFNALVLGPWSIPKAQADEAERSEARKVAHVIVREFAEWHHGLVLGFYRSQDSCLPEIRPALFMHPRQDMNKVHQILRDAGKAGRTLRTLFLIDEINTRDSEPCLSLLDRGRDVEAATITLTDELPKPTMTTHQDFVFVWIKGAWAEQVAAASFWRRFADDLGPKLQNFDDFWDLWSSLSSLEAPVCLVLSRVHQVGHGLGLFWSVPGPLLKSDARIKTLQLFYFGMYKAVCLGTFRICMSLSLCQP
jgi:hypothetical protein